MLRRFGFALFWVLCPCVIFGLNAWAQPAEEPLAWVLFYGTEQQPWPDAPLAPGDSLAPISARVLALLAEVGFLTARVDSVVFHPAAQPTAAALYVSRGKPYHIRSVTLAGTQALDAEALVASMASRPRTPFAPGRLKQDLVRLLQAYEGAGHPFASVQVQALRLEDQGQADEHGWVDVRLQVVEGEALPFYQLRAPGASRTTTKYLARLVGVREGSPLKGFHPADVQQRLLNTTFFTAVGQPEVYVVPDSGLVVSIPVEEASPGGFDLVLGYVPDTATRQGGVVGQGQLVLRNLFGGGRTMALKLDRLPGLSSRLDVALNDPFILGWPLGLSGRFQGVQQDSTYGKQNVRLGVHYRLAEGMTIEASLQQEVTRPGQAGARVVAGRQRVARAKATFGGLGMTFERLDFPLNPRRGWSLQTHLEQGRKSVSRRQVDAEGDTTFTASDLRQERLTARGRVLLPTWNRQVAVLGADAALLLSEAYDESDLFRVGGASTLRGYNEDQFLGHRVLRLLAEYRYVIDRTSYLFLFADYGFIHSPVFAGQGERKTRHPGYGAGIQMETGAGLVQASYAFSPDDGPANGRIHVGFSFGL